MKISAVIKSMRPHQYIKNLFIFLPLFFAMKITDTTLLSNTIIAFIAFSLTASAVYTLNDHLDIEEDKLHPRKKNRPIASGAISRSQSIVIMILLAVVGFVLMATLSFKAVGILAAYVVMNIAYSLYLKHIAIIDIVIIAIGFVLRLFVGAAVTSLNTSKWIILMTFLLALFLALAKRRDDILLFNKTGQKMRKVIDGYNQQYLDTAMAIMASVVIVSYIMYTISPEVIARVNNHNIYLTTLFVILGIMRYLQISLVFKEGGSPTKIILKDRFMQLTLIGWALTFVYILY